MALSSLKTCNQICLIVLTIPTAQKNKFNETRVLKNNPLFDINIIKNIIPIKAIRYLSKTHSVQASSFLIKSK